MSNMEEIEALKAEQAKLKTSRDGLELDRVELKVERTQLKVKREAAELERTQLKVKRAQLQAKLDTLKEELDQLKATEETDEQKRLAAEKERDIREKIINAERLFQYNHEEIICVGQEITGIDSRITGIDTKVTGIDSRITAIGQEITGIDTKVTGIDTKVTGIDSRMTAIGQEITGIDSRITSIGQEITGIDTKVTALKPVPTPAVLGDQVIKYMKEKEAQADDESVLGCIPRTLFRMAGCDATNPHNLRIALGLYSTAFAWALVYRSGVADTGIWWVIQVLIAIITKLPSLVWNYVVLAVVVCSSLFLLPAGSYSVN